MVDRCPWLRRAPLGVAARFWPKVSKTDGCWNWTASKNSWGYGTIVDDDGRTRTAHRISWRLHHGAEPTGCVLHRCDNPACVRPDHLFLGTVQDNNADMMAKGREQRGERSGLAVLTDERVRAMRALRRDGIGTREIARRFGISNGTASYAIRGITWGHVK